MRQKAKAENQFEFDHTADDDDEIPSHISNRSSLIAVQNMVIHRKEMLCSLFW